MHVYCHLHVVAFQEQIKGSLILLGSMWQVYFPFRKDRKTQNIISQKNTILPIPGRMQFFSSILGKNEQNNVRFIPRKVFVLLNKNMDTLCSMYSSYSRISSLITVKLISCTCFALFRFDVPSQNSPIRRGVAWSNWLAHRIIPRSKF